MSASSAFIHVSALKWFWNQKFPGGHPSNYRRSQTLLNFNDYKVKAVSFRLYRFRLQKTKISSVRVLDGQCQTNKMQLGPDRRLHGWTLHVCHVRRLHGSTLRLTDGRHYRWFIGSRRILTLDGIKIGKLPMGIAGGSLYTPL